MGLTKDEQIQIALLLELNNKKLIDEMQKTFVSKELAMKCIILALVSGFVGGKLGILQGIMNFIV